MCSYCRRAVAELLEVPSCCQRYNSMFVSINGILLHAAKGSKLSSYMKKCIHLVFGNKFKRYHIFLQISSGNRSAVGGGEGAEMAGVCYRGLQCPCLFSAAAALAFNSSCRSLLHGIPSFLSLQHRLASRTEFSATVWHSPRTLNAYVSLSLAGSCSLACMQPIG
jgi:hypothetical protein